MSLEREFQKEKQVCNGERQEIDDLNRGRRIVRESRRARHLFIYLFIDMFYKDCQIVQMD